MICLHRRRSQTWALMLQKHDLDTGLTTMPTSITMNAVKRFLYTLNAQQQNIILLILISSLPLSHGILPNCNVLWPLLYSNGPSHIYVDKYQVVCRYSLYSGDTYNMLCRHTYTCVFYFFGFCLVWLCSLKCWQYVQQWF